MTLLNLSPTAGTPPDLAARLKSVLPRGWFADTTPVLDSVLNGLAAAWSALFALLASVQSQSRIATANGIFLDLVAQDYLGANVQRRTGEPDATLRARISATLLRDHVTRAAVTNAIVVLTGRPPRITEPARIADTGAYNNAATLAYNTAGAWGSRNVPFQLFIHAYRPVGIGVAHCAGYGISIGGYGEGAIQYTTPTMAASQVQDTDITQTIAATLPIATTAWVVVSD